MNVAQLLDDTFAEWKWDQPNTLLSAWYYPVSVIVAYLIGIVVLKFLVKGMKPMTLTGVQVVYNVAMVALAFSMGVSILIAAWSRSQRLGVMSLICERPEDVPLSGAFGFIIYVFYLSKYVELFDTVLLILRQKPVIPLHVFHHGIIILITWSWLDGSWIVGSWWCVFVNSTVHTFMYYYYLLASLGQNVWWKKMLTMGQIIQFWSGFFLVNYWFWIREEEGCVGGLFAAALSHGGNMVLIVLFIRFFVSTYFGGRREKKE